VLIVDDYREVARTLRAGLESLQANFQIQDVPSGEEALLEFYHPIDLLIADVRLPGISGLELMKRFKTRFPQGKVILISGVTDPQVRRQVAMAGADAFLFKPIEMADFLDAVERTLGMVESLLPSEMEVEARHALAMDDLPSISSNREKPSNLADYLAQLRYELGATAVVLLDSLGEVVLQAGDLPDQLRQPELSNSVMAVLNAGAKLNAQFGTGTPQSILFFSSSHVRLFLFPISPAYTLFVVITFQEDIAWQTVMWHMQTAVQDLKAILVTTGVTLVATSAPNNPEESESIELAEEEIGGLQTLIDSTRFKVEDVDRFWEEATEASSTGQAANSESLNYDQARQLGLAPDQGD
jgi:CheY-like chemotaxis protein/predicted regulator of Ras-like GTPase activity (Roadblock/LC7/MglB family)